MAMSREKSLFDSTAKQCTHFHSKDDLLIDISRDARHQPSIFGGLESFALHDNRTKLLGHLSAKATKQDGADTPFYPDCPH